MDSSGNKRPVIDEAIEASYDWVFDDDAFQRCISSLEVLNSGGISIRVHVKKDFSRATIANNLNFSPDSYFKYNSYYYQMDPLLRVGQFITSHRIMENLEFIDRCELIRTEFYAEILQRSGQSRFMLLALPTKFSTGWLAMGMPFEKEEERADELKATMEELRPHLQRAAKLRSQRLASELRYTRSILHSLTTPTLLATSAGEIVDFNESAAPFFAVGGSPNKGSRGDGTLRVEELTGAIQVAVNGDKPAHFVRMQDSDGRSIAAQIIVFSRRSDRLNVIEKEYCGVPDARVVVFLRRIQKANFSFAEDFANSAGLTPAEWEVVMRLLAGETLGEAAQSLGRSRNTVRNQLANVMEKLGARRQTDLIRLFSSMS